MPRAVSENGAEEWVDPPIGFDDVVRRLREQLDLAEPLDADAMSWPSDEVEAKYRALNGKVRRAVVDRLESAYFAAFGLGASDVWKERLRAAVAFALSCSTPGARPRYVAEQPGVFPVDAKSIAAWVKRKSPAGTVPSGLTSARVTKLLAVSTLGRGGGPTRKVHYSTAVDDLVREIDTGTSRP